MSFPQFAQVFVEKWKSAVDIARSLWIKPGIKT